MADYTLKIKIDADDRATPVLSGVRQTLDTLGGGLKSLGVAALGGLGALAGAATGAGAALAKLAIDAAPLEQIQSAFTGLAESAGASSDQMLAALQESSAGMVSQRDLMLSFNKAAQLVGTDFAVQLPDAMQYLNKVSASTGQDMDFMLNSLVVGVGRLSPMILDNLGIQVSLEEATSRAAKMFGVEADQLSKSQIQTGMMNVVLEKLATNTENIPDVAGSAAAGIGELRARFADLKDQIGLAFVPALNSVLGVVANLADRYLPPLVEALQTYVAPAIETVVSAFGGFVSHLAAGQDPLQAFKTLISNLFPPEISGAISSVIDGIRQFITTIQPYVEQAAAWLAQNVELKDILIALGIVLGVVVVGALATLVQAIAPVIAAGALLIAAVAAIRTAWETDFLGIRTFVQETLAAIQQWWADHGAQVVATVQAFLAGIRSAWERFAAFWQEIFAAFRSAFEGDWRAFGEHLRAAFDQAWENIKQIGKAAWDAIRRFFAETDWGAVGRAILEGIANGVKSGVDWLTQAAKDAAKAAYDAARGFLGIHSPSTLFAGVGEQMMAGMAQGIRQAAQLPELALAHSTPTAPAQRAAPANTQSVVIYGGVTVSGVQDAPNLLRQLWELGYA